MPRLLASCAAHGKRPSAAMRGLFNTCATGMSKRRGALELAAAQRSFSGALALSGFGSLAVAIAHAATDENEALRRKR